MDVVFTDFEKAYDSVWHDGLIYKLIQHKLHGQFLSVIQMFLKTRYSRVTLKQTKSTWKLQKKGLPQGSSLSPILYILFTNDFKLLHTKWVRMGCFADDTAFWLRPASKNPTQYQILQRELNRFSDWCRYWQLTINAGKCHSMSISRITEPKYHPIQN